MISMQARARFEKILKNKKIVLLLLPIPAHCYLMKKTFGPQQKPHPVF
jgi:hypothetical protein